MYIQQVGNTLALNFLFIMSIVLSNTGLFITALGAYCEFQYQGIQYTVQYYCIRIFFGISFVMVEKNEVQGLKVSKNSGGIYEDILVSSGSVRKTCLAEA